MRIAAASASSNHADMDRVSFAQLLRAPLALPLASEENCKRCLQARERSFNSACIAYCARQRDYYGARAWPRPRRCATDAPCGLMRPHVFVVVGNMVVTADPSPTEAASTLRRSSGRRRALQEGSELQKQEQAQPGEVSTLSPRGVPHERGQQQHTKSGANLAISISSDVREVDIGQEDTQAKPPPLGTLHTAPEVEFAKIGTRTSTSNDDNVAPRSASAPAASGAQQTQVQLTTAGEHEKMANGQAGRAARARRQRDRRRRDRAMASARKALVKKIAALGKEGRWREALSAADDAARTDGLSPDLFVYSSCVGAVAHSGRWQEALALLRRMRTAGIIPTTAVYNAAIHACGSAGKWRRALRLLDEMRGCANSFNVGVEKEGEEDDADEGEEDAGVINADFLISGPISGATGPAGRAASAANGGSLASKKREAKVGEHDPPEPDIVTYNTVMSACGRAGEWRLTLEVMQAARERGLLPNQVTYNTAISACGKGGQADMALSLLEDMPRAGLTPDSCSFNSAISACATEGRWERVLSLLKRMKASSGKGRNAVSPDVFSFSAAITACGRGRQWGIALGLMDVMKRWGIRPGRVAFNAAISACGECGQWERALGLLREMQEVGAAEENGKPVGPDRVSFNAAIKACSDSGEWERAVSLLEEMQGTGPKTADAADSSTSSSNTSNSSTITRSSVVHGDERKVRITSGAPSPDVVSYSTAITACSRAGKWELALGLLDRMQGEGIAPNVTTFTAAITACRQGGQPRLVLTLLDSMSARGVKPDAICYSAALRCCADGAPDGADSDLCDRARELLAEMDMRKLSLDARARRAVANTCGGLRDGTCPGVGSADDEQEEEEESDR